MLFLFMVGMRAARWDTELMFPCATRSVELLCFLFCGAELTHSHNAIQLP